MNDHLHLSDNGYDVIRKGEGLRLEMYLDPVGLPTIGYGHLIPPAERGQARWAKALTKDEAEALLREDVAKAEASVKAQVKVALTQGQFDALVDFVFNLGGARLGQSTLLKKLNRGDYAAVPAELLRWDKGRDPKTGKLVPLKGLTKRRQKEAELWES